MDTWKRVKVGIGALAILFGFLAFGFGSYPLVHAEGGASAIQGRLQGTWKSVCMKLDSGRSMIMTSTYSGSGSSQDKVVFYKDAGCGTPSGLVKTNSSVSYTIGAPQSLGAKQVYPIDSTIQSWQLTQNGAVLQSGGAVPTQYDIFTIEGNKLYTSGLTRSQRGPITNPAQRPTTLDTTNYFVKQ